LTRRGAARRLKFIVQFLNFTPESLPFGLRSPQILSRPAQFLAQPFILSAQVVDRRGRIGRWLRPTRWHAPVMPDSLREYKREMRVSTH
jgi:hypothetical protein